MAFYADLSVCAEKDKFIEDFRPKYWQEEENLLFLDELEGFWHFLGVRMPTDLS